VDLGKMFAVLWARRLVLAAGILAGLLISFLAVNTVRFSMDANQPFLSFAPKVQSVYSTTLRMVLDEPNFGIGRVGIIDPNQRREKRELDKLAAVYSYLVVSDDLMANLSSDVKNSNADIKAAPVEGLPIIEVIVKGNNPDEIRSIASKAASNFIGYVKREQVQNEVPPLDRISVRTIGEPSLAATEQSRRMELAFVFFLLPVFFAGLVAFVLENLKRDRSAGEHREHHDQIGDSGEPALRHVKTLKRTM
jgi:hypothetical protein